MEQLADSNTITAIRHKRGGLFFEGFEVGSLTEHRYYRTVTQMDNMLFSNMTLNPQPLHIDRHFCEQETEWGQPLMNSLFTLGLMIGIHVSDMTNGTTIANLGMTDVKFPHPLFEGDTVHCTTEVVGKRESKSRPGAGIVEFHHRATIRTTSSWRSARGARSSGWRRSDATGRTPCPLSLNAASRASAVRQRRPILRLRTARAAGGGSAAQKQEHRGPAPSNAGPRIRP